MATNGSRVRAFSLALLLAHTAQAVIPTSAPIDAGTPAVADEPDAGDQGDGGYPSTGVSASLPAAAPISFKATLTKAEVTLAEPFALTIEVRHNAGETYTLPQNLELREFGLREQKAETHGEDPKTTLIRLTLQAFAVGDLTLPAIRLAVDAKGVEQQLEIPPQKIKVLGVVDASQGPAQMKEDSAPLPSLRRWILWPIWVLLAIVLGIGGAWWWHRRKKKAEAVALARPRLPAFDEALLRMQALQDENLVARGQKQDFYFRLSEIIRDFIGRRYGFESLEMTSDELLHEVLVRPTPGLDFDALSKFTRDGDMVKFAKLDPTEGDCRTIFDLGRGIVISAKPPREPIGPATSQGGTP